MLFAMQNTDFHVLDLFCRESYVRAVMHIIVSLDILGTLIAVLEQKTNEDISSPFLLKSFFLSERQLVNANLRVQLDYMKKMSFS